MAKIIFAQDEQETYSAYQFIQDLITNQPLMATLLFQGLLQLEEAPTRKLTTGKQITPDIHLAIGNGNTYQLQTRKIENSVDQPIQELRVIFKDKSCILTYFVAIWDDETYYCFVKGSFREKNPFMDKIDSYREETKRIFIRSGNLDISRSPDFNELKKLAWQNDGIVHYLESFSASLGQYIFIKRIKKKWSQLDLSLKTGLSPSIVERVEAGDPDISMRMYQKAVQLLEIEAQLGDTGLNLK
ncbi:helix-turn-helix domain-containing protein [Listeria grayi]|uniref:DNA-binding protein n=1 Tax=Listeria grayi DSM 20601 TaxID=525367 RepID=D7UV39_LISGR|nr:helix-turn-helix transcriptional regulator [Listeria grayi]EFI85115.1 DNA-binding protein [Listeria grayi DSM 20601]